MGFPRQEYWSGLPCLLPGDLPDLETQPASFTSLALAARFFMTSTTWEAQSNYTPIKKKRERNKHLAEQKNLLIEQKETHRLRK